MESLRSLRQSERGQATQIGAVLLFGILIIALSIHQASIVPNQNRQVEFNHFTDAQGDMVILRNDVMLAGNMERTIPSSVDLGVSYPPRLLAAQPSRSYGTLRTHNLSTSYSLSTSDNVADICGLNSLSAHAVVYQPNYNYLNSVGNITQTNTVVYTSGSRQGRAIQTSQQIVSGTTIHLYPILGNFSRSGESVAAVSFVGGAGGSKTLSGPFTLTIPTTLPASEWDRLLSEQTVDSIPGKQAVEINFDSSQNYNIKCSPVGVDASPKAILDGDGDATRSSIGFVSGSADSSGGQNAVVSFTLKNTGASGATITDLAVNSTSTIATRIQESGPEVSTNRTGGVYTNQIDIGGPAVALNPDPTIPVGGATEFTLDKFKPDSGPPVDMSREDVTVTVYFSDGSSELYTFTVA